MARFVYVFFSLFFTSMVFGQNTRLQQFYVGTYTSEGAKGINLCTLDTETGEIKLVKTFTGVDNPSFVRLSPDRKYLYAVSETAKNDGKTGYAYAYKVEKNGDLTLLNSQESNGDNPCHVDVSGDGKNVVVSNYSSGTIAFFEVKDDGSLSPAIETIQNEGSGPNKRRQEGPHAHSTKFSPFTNEVFNADLGTDHLNIFHLENGSVIQEGQSFVQIPPGSGPRHFAFYPNGETIFVISELSSTVTVVNKIEDKWVAGQNISTLPDNFKGESYCADIHLSKDNKFLYGSNRGHNSIAIFKVNEKDQTLEMLGTIPVEGNWPRNFGITPDGKWMLVANQRSGNITVFKIDSDNGKLTYSGNEIKLPAPVCIEFR
ncbi:MAG TPA: lactonase family protein [Draconibacterium sp.]|nr:lactonase family protein [Draconibacterium sp.]